MSGEIPAREGMDQQFRAACAASTTANCNGLGNPLALAGLLRHTLGSARAALSVIRRMPPGDVWSTVHGYLERLADDEVADTERPRASGE